MGFLDHSTNNIIIDAVLTDTGRQMLANNQGNFKIAFFSLGDDEVDYSTIEKFGRAVGKEKIAKNTPVFEAQTLASLAMKSRLITLPNASVYRLPTYTFSAGAVMNAANTGINLIQTGAPDQSEALVNLREVMAGGGDVPEGVVDTTFTVLVPDRFLYLNTSVVGVEPTTRTATYVITAAGDNTPSGGAQGNFTLKIRSIDDTMWNIYGVAENKNVIKTVVTAIGDQSGIRTNIAVQISRTGSP